MLKEKKNAYKKFHPEKALAALFNEWLDRQGIDGDNPDPILTPEQDEFIAAWETLDSFFKEEK